MVIWARIHVDCCGSLPVTRELATQIYVAATISVGS